MIVPTTSDMGRVAVFRDRPDTEPALSIVTSFDRFFVFVRYGSETTSRAEASHLEWAGLVLSKLSWG